MDSNTLVIVLQSQDSDYGRTSTLRKLINSIDNVTTQTILKCAGMYDADHGRGECIGVLSQRIASFDAQNIFDLLRCFDSDYGRNSVVQSLSDKFEAITSGQVAQILQCFDFDHGKITVLNKIAPKIQSVQGKDLESILDTFDSDHGKTSAIGALGSKITINVQSMMSVADKFDSDHSKSSVIEKMAGHLTSSSTKMGFLQFWETLGTIAEDKKLNIVLQNIDSLDFKCYDPQNFCDVFSRLCVDTFVFITVCGLCGIDESTYKPIIDRIARESQIITIHGTRYNTADFAIGQLNTFMFDTDEYQTFVSVTRNITGTITVCTKSLNKKHRGTSSCITTTNPKKGLCIDADGIHS